MKNEKMMYLRYCYLFLYRCGGLKKNQVRACKFGFLICLVSLCVSCERISEEALKLKKIDPEQVLNYHYAMYGITTETDRHCEGFAKNDHDIVLEVYKNFAAGMLSAITFDLINGR